MKTLKTAAASLALVAALGACTNEPERDDAGAIVETGELDAFSIKVGDCIEDPVAGEEFTSVGAVPCSEPHNSEAYYVFDLPEGALPIGTAMETAVSDGCLTAFDEYVGLDYQYSSYGLLWLEPSIDSWAQGDREIVCLIGDLEGELLVGSAKGTAI